MQRREFHQLLALACSAGIGLPLIKGCANPQNSYDLPRFGNVHLLHTTDVHAQLLPIYYREPSENIGLAAAQDRPPHLVGEWLLSRYGLTAGSREAHAFTHLDFCTAAEQFGRVGGFAHLATLVKRLKANRPNALLLDGGDLWQGSATALWSQGQDMVDAAQLLGVDVMTGHWEFTLGAERVRQIISSDLAGSTQFVAQNVRDTDFEDPVFASHVVREVNGIPVAIIGQAFPYTPIANPAHFTEGWSFGIRERELQQVVDAARVAGAEVVVLLSHNGADVDIKLASRVRGIDVILGGHTHDALPQPVSVVNPGGRTLVSNAGSNGKFIAMLDFDVRGGKVRDIRYQLLPVFSDLLPPDPEMEDLIQRVRAPYEEQLGEVLAHSEGLLYRRGNFNGSFDQVILQALLEEKDAEVALSPGFRWGTTLLPGEPITVETLMNQVAVTYPETTLTQMRGDFLKYLLEDVADNLFNADPYLQQGGDMVRTGGLTYTLDLTARFGGRIRDLHVRGQPVRSRRIYRVAGWAPMQPGDGEPIWSLCSRWLRRAGNIPAVEPWHPEVRGIAGNRGFDNGHSR